MLTYLLPATIPSKHPQAMDSRDRARRDFLPTEDECVEHESGGLVALCTLSGGIVSIVVRTLFCGAVLFLWAVCFSSASAQPSVWSRIGPDYRFGAHSAVASDGAVYVTGYHGPELQETLTRLSASGSLDWERRFSWPFTWGVTRIAAMANGGVLLLYVADTGYGEMTLTQFSAAGDIVWSRQYDAGDEVGVFLPQFLDSLPDGTVAVLGLAGVGDGFGYPTVHAPFLLKVAPGGAVEAATWFGGVPGQPELFPAGLSLRSTGETFVACNDQSGAGVILKLDASGAPLWARITSDARVRAVHALPDGRATAVVEAVDAGGSALAVGIAEFSASGALVRSLVQPPLAFSDETVVLLDDGGYAAIGNDGVLFRRVSPLGSVVNRQLAGDGRIVDALTGATDGFVATGGKLCNSAGEGQDGSMVLRLGAAGESCLGSTTAGNETAIATVSFGDYPFVDDTFAVTTAGTTFTVSNAISGWVESCLPACRAAMETEFEIKEPQKVLLHKYREDDDYPSEYQRRLDGDTIVASPDRHMDVRVRVKAASDGAPVAGRPVYFRVNDPPDTAPYVVQNGDAHDNDNRDRSLLKGKLLTGAACPDAPEGVICALSGADGWARVVLETSEHISGENYEVEASLDPGFDCPSTCPHSATITTWKRVYLENDSMFRHGSFVAANVAAGGTSIDVTDIDPFRGKVGKKITLIHADPVLAIGPRRFYMEEHIIRAITPGTDGGGTIAFRDGESLNLSYAPAEQDRSGRTVRHLADGVGLVSGNWEADVFFADPSYLNALFDPAFVEYIILDEGGANTVPYVPFVKPVPAATVGTLDDPQVQFAQKWFERNGASNQHYLAGVTGEDNGSGQPSDHRGVTTSNVGLTQSLVFVQQIQGSTLVAELVTHEVAHQWHVNPKTRQSGLREHDGPDGESDYPQWDTSSNEKKWCQMRWNADCDGSQTCPSFKDGITAFHYLQRVPRGVDSEYLWIRERCEPVPAVRPDIREWWLVPPVPCR